jgi:hypothetical protein
MTIKGTITADGTALRLFLIGTGTTPRCPEQFGDGAQQFSMMTTNRLLSTPEKVDDAASLHHIPIISPPQAPHRTICLVLGPYPPPITTGSEEAAARLEIRLIGGRRGDRNLTPSASTNLCGDRKERRVSSSS